MEEVEEKIEEESPDREVINHPIVVSGKPHKHNFVYLFTDGDGRYNYKCSVDGCMFGRASKERLE